MSPLLLFSIGGIFMAVMLLVLGVALILTPDNLAGRLREVANAGLSPTLAELMPLQSGTPSGAWLSAAKLLPKTPKDLTRLRTRLSRGGIRFTGAEVVFSLSEIIAPIVLAATLFLTLPVNLRWLGAAIGAAIGFFGPGLLLERRIKERQRQIEDGLPDALDLIVVCMEAGSGLDQALMRTAHELGIAYPVLAEELRQLNTEVRAGKPRMEAFKSLAQRTKVDDIRSLVAMLIQTDRFGTSIGQALRTHAETSRIKRRQRAEEAAQKIAVKLVFPLVLFFFPALYIVLLGPAIIQFVRTFM